MKRLIRIVVFALTAVLCAGAVSPPRAAHAVTVTTLPADTTVAVCDEFLVRAMIDDFAELKAFQLIYQFDPAKLQFLGAVEGEVLPAGNFADFVTMDTVAPIDSITYDASVLSGKTSGPGVLVYLRFKPVIAGSSDLDLQLADLRDSQNNQTLAGMTDARVHAVQAGTTTSLVSDNNPAKPGTKINFTATVTPSSATGLVEFFDGITSLGTVPLAGGMAILSTSGLSTGPHSITATYLGDACFAASTSNKVDQLVVEPVVSIGGVKVIEGDAGKTEAVFIVSLSNPSGNPVTVNYQTADNSATLDNSDYQFASGTVTIPAGNLSTPVTVLVSGDTKFEPQESFFVNISNPVGATIGNGQGVGLINNDDTAPLVSIDDVKVIEGDAGSVAAIFTVSLSNPSADPVSVDFTTADGSATLANEDYRFASGTVTIPPKSTSALVTVAVNGDVKFELQENYFVNLSNPVNALIGDGQGEGLINDDDDQPTVSIGDIKVIEGDAGKTEAVLTVSLSVLSGADVTVNYQTADGSATLDNNDYQPASSSVTISSKTMSAEITVLVTGDTKFEPQENFFVNLSNSVNALIGDGQGEVTINNDDGEPRVSIGDVKVVEGNSGKTEAVLTVLLSNPTATDVTVDYQTADGSATLADSDYQFASGTVTIPAKATSVQITVLVTGDIVNELQESFVVNLSNAVGATIGDSEGTVTINNDDLGPQVTVITPNGGEDLIVGVPFKVSWTATDDKPGVLVIDLYASNDMGANYQVVALGEANDGTYMWTPGPEFATNEAALPEDEALFKVVATDADGKVGQDVSDAFFSIFTPATPTMLSLFLATSIPDGIELRWQFAQPSELRGVVVERAIEAAGPWTLLALESRTENDQVVAIDRSASAGLSYLYRLRATLENGEVQVFGPLSAQMSEPLVLGLRVGPIPSRGPVRIDYTMPKMGPSRVSVIDIQGREIALLAHGVQQPGRYQTIWNSRSDTPMGVYFVRYLAGDQILTRRVVVTR